MDVYTLLAGYLEAGMRTMSHSCETAMIYLFFSGGSSTVPAGLPSPAYYARFVGCIEYLRLQGVASEARKQRVDLVADRNVHDTLAFCDDDDDNPT